ncbi:MAG: D-tyrosyl-tRNA(Tyr) deacylase [Deltaproteobacteria bacterium]|nr:D-tyrosyl-tRNA(Tyr) deacylase [Deltaproteobacteria bacterium]
MKILLQRVREAKASVSGSVVGSVGHGYLALVGAAGGDDKPTADWLAEKTLGLRVFEDEDGRMNKSLEDVGGSILLVSQFTLLADCRRGRRPSFAGAAGPELAKSLYEYLGETLARRVPVAYGRFGAHMEVSLVNDGPVTVMLERSPEGGSEQ